MTRTRSGIGGRIETLRRSLGLSQVQFAEKLGVTQATVSAWERGEKKRAPSAEAFFRLGSLAPAAEDKVHFWSLAGLDEQSITEAADGIREVQMSAPSPGEIVRARSYVIAGGGLTRGGADVPLPAEFIPNPGSTVCLRIDQRSGGVVSAPRGLFIVDKSKANVSELRRLVGRVIVLSFVPGIRNYETAPSGIYVGRVTLSERLWGGAENSSLRQYWNLALLAERGGPASHLSLAIEDIKLPFEVPRNFQAEGALGVPNLLLWLNDRPVDRRSFDEAREYLASLARIGGGSSLIGEVIGRLSGHIMRESHAWPGRQHKAAAGETE